MAESKPLPQPFIAILIDDSTQIELIISGLTKKFSNEDLSEYPSLSNPDVDPDAENLRFFNGVTVLPYKPTSRPGRSWDNIADKLLNPRIIMLGTDAGVMLRGIRMKILGKHGIVNEHIGMAVSYMKQAIPEGGEIHHLLETHLYTIGDEVVTEAMLPAGAGTSRNALIFAPTIPVILEQPKNLLAKFKQVAYFGERFWQELKPNRRNSKNPYELPYDEIEGKKYYLWNREQRLDIFANPEDSTNSRFVFGYHFWKNYWSRQSLSEKEQKWFATLDYSSEV